MSKGSNFSNWVDQQRIAESARDEEEGGSSTIMGQLNSLQDSFANQLFELSGSLADAPLSAAFRTRVTHSIYLIGISVSFGILAAFIGLPTLILKPAKFMICMTLSTLSAAGSVVVLQKPSVFLGNLLHGGARNATPVLLLTVSLLFTMYATIIVHQYILVILAGFIQLLCTAIFLASFIPGGLRGLLVLLNMGYAVLRTALTPCIFIAKRGISSLISSLMSR